MARKALITECPICSGVRSNRTTRTRPGVKALPFIMESIAKQHMGAAPGFRVRERQCDRCGQQFETVEIPHQVFAAFQREFEELRRNHCRLLDIIEGVQTSLAACSQLFPRDSRFRSLLKQTRERIANKRRKSGE